MLLLAAAAKAPQIPTGTPSGGVFDEVSSLSGLFTVITNAIIMVGLGLVLIFLALGFIKFITSQGDKVATEQAQKWVTYAILGGVGLLAVFAVRSLLLTVIGSEGPAENVPPTG